MKGLLREPLFHFLIVGAALFAASTFVSDGDLPRDDEIVVSAGQIEHLTARFTRTWRRPPTPEELKGLVDEYLREEVAYREGMSIGLDRDDTIIRRRIRQKLDFIAADIVSIAEPSDEDLEEYLSAHAEPFRIQSRYTFVQVYLDPQKHGDDLDSEAQRLLVVLNDAPQMDTRELGDRFLLEYAMEDVSVRQISRLFGEDFATALEGLEPEQPNAWGGPIASGYGLHLVRIDSKTEGRDPELNEVRDAVRREWENARQVESKEQFYQELLNRYEVTVEWLDLEDASGTP